MLNGILRPAMILMLIRLFGIPNFPTVGTASVFDDKRQSQAEVYRRIDLNNDWDCRFGQ